MDPYAKSKKLHAAQIPPQLRGQDSSSSSHPGSDEVTVVHHEHEPRSNYELDDLHDNITPRHKKTMAPPPSTAAARGPQQQPSMDPNPDSSYHYHSEHGPPIDNALKYDEAEEDFQHHRYLFWSRVRHELRDPFAEFLGCFIMILFGDGSVAQVQLSANEKLPPSSQNKGDYQSISWG